MNRLRITLNDRKRIVLSTAMAAVFVFLAGGANALANTVWTVSKTSSNATCSLPSKTTCNTIGAAVNATGISPGDVIVVGRGTYNESVYIHTDNLSIFGAQAGKDARVRRNDPSKESIVDATGQSGGPGGGAAFFLKAAVSCVVIDGFTIQGGTSGDFASGIFLYGYTSAYVAYDDQLVNNIIQNNAVGIDLYYYPAGTLIEYNRFKTNNTGTVNDVPPTYYAYPAYGPGYGIVAYGTYYVTITENAFEGNLAAAMSLYVADTTEITKNTSMDDGSFAILYYCYYVFVDHNQGQDFGAKGLNPLYPGYSADGAIDLLYLNEYMQINDNDLEKGRISNYNGIAFSNLYGADDTVCEYCQVSNNTVRGFRGNGIAAEAIGGDYGTLYYCGISGNDVEDNGGDGILIGAGYYNYGNTLFDNKLEGNHTNDCEDDTSGTWTEGTYDTWFKNIGTLSLPAGLCSSH